MAIKSVWGFGGVQFEYDTTVTFTHGQGKLWFQQVNNIYTAKSGAVTNILQGYRAMMSIKLWQTEADGSEAILFQQLIEMLNMANGAAITIYPKYDSATSSTLSYSMVLVSDINIEDLANNTPIGQSLELQFTGSHLLTVMPTLIDNPAEYFVIDENGNQVVDENANNLTAEQ